MAKRKAKKTAAAKRAIGYVRVSTEEQATQGVSVAAQRQALETWAGREGVELEVYSDNGLSGSKMANRPGLQAALAQAKAEQVPFVTHSLSRFARSTVEALMTVEELQGAGAGFVSLSERIDTTTAVGKMSFTMLAAFAEFERNLTAERTKAALAFKKSKLQAYGPTPLGYDRKGDKLVKNREQLQAVRKIQDWRESGWTLAKIAARLNETNVPTKRGGTWFPSTVKYLLENDLYA